MIIIQSTKPEFTNYQCEVCKKTIKAVKNKLSAWVRCDCGGMAFEFGWKANGTPSNWKGGK